LLPPSQRCRNQTEKDPTGPYKRDKLLKYLEEQAKGEKDWEEVVPFNPGVKRGKVYEQPPDQPGQGTFRKSGEGDDKGDMQMPIELDIDDEEEDEEFNENDEALIEKALKNAPERDLVDLAGILGE
jgi:tropomodulin